MSKKEYPVQDRKLLGVVDETIPGENEYFEKYLNGELRFVEFEESYATALTELRNSYFAICMMFDEAAKLAPNRKTKKQCQHFCDMFHGVLNNVGLTEEYERFLITEPDFNAILNGGIDNGTEA